MSGFLRFASKVQEFVEARRVRDFELLGPELARESAKMTLWQLVPPTVAMLIVGIGVLVHGRFLVGLLLIGISGASARYQLWPRILYLSRERER